MPQSEEAAAWFAAVYQAVQEIPHGKVTSYGHIATLIGYPERPRQVGVCLKHLPSAASQPNARYNSDTVPWQRVINAKGVISPRGVNGAANHETVLAQEGVQVDRGSLGERTVDFRVYGWFPNELPSREAEAEAEEAEGDSASGDGEDQVLITGATGHVGFRTLLDLMIAGYNPRIAVRSQSKEQLILTNPEYKAVIQNTTDDPYDFVIVPEITVPNAYLEAVKGVDYAIHIASPIESGGRLKKDEFDEHLIQPAVRATLNILEAAKSEARVKRVVITSSVYATVPYKYLSTRDMAESEIYTADHRLAFDEGPYEDESQAYAASKVKALNESERWMRENEPSFDLVNIHPPFVLGRNDLVTNAEDAMRGTNGVILRPALGKANPNPLPGCSAHLEDIARLHVEALQAGIPAGSYQAATNGAKGIRWEEVNGIVQQLFPEAVQEGVLPNSGGSKTLACHLGVSKTEEAFGWKFQGFERQVESVIEHYLELRRGV